MRSWDDQVRHFARGWRCVTAASRGYSPSDALEDEKQYGQSAMLQPRLSEAGVPNDRVAHITSADVGQKFACRNV
jgi:hypothetical protein